MILQNLALIFEHQSLKSLLHSGQDELKFATHNVSSLSDEFRNYQQNAPHMQMCTYEDVSLVWSLVPLAYPSVAVTAYLHKFECTIVRYT